MMKPKYERGDLLLPSDSGKPWPSYLKKITIKGIGKNAGHYFLQDASGCFWSAPYKMIETNFIKQIQHTERKKELSF